MPYHVLLDTAGETKLGKLSIGTTRRGIGPCYADKALRLGIRVQDLLDEKILRTKIRAALEPKQQALRELSVQRRKLRKEAGEEAKAAAEGSMAGVAGPAPRPAHDGRGTRQLRPPARAPHRRHREALLGRARRRQDGDLRGRPGDPARPRPRHLSLRHLLQPDRRRGDASAPGVGPTDIDEVWGIAKAYATRVGAGPFPTELDDEIGERMVEQRPRVRHHHRPPAALRLDGPGRPALRGPPQPDERAGDHQARRAERHRPAAGRGPLPLQGGRRPRRASPTTSRSCTRPTPEYEELPGFDEDITGCKSSPNSPPPRATTSASSPSSSACRSSWPASGPTATRSSGSSSAPRVPGPTGEHGLTDKSRTESGHRTALFGPSPGL